jgi:hypothetical protein
VNISVTLSPAAISGIVGLARGARTDQGAGVPRGTLEGLIPLGYAERTKRGFGPTQAARLQVKEWNENRTLPQVVLVAKKPPVEGAKKKGLPAREGKLAPSVRITARVVNPKKIGTQSWSYYTVAQGSSTVADYRSAGGDMRYLLQFLYVGLIQVG